MKLRRHTGCMNRYNRSDKVREGFAAPLQSKRLLDQVRERIRYLHYSLQTEKAYVYWARFFVLWSGSQGGMRHPRDMGVVEVEAFLTMLANERQVSPATHRQALNAILFMYRQVLGMELPWMQQIGRPAERKRIPVVLTKEEVQRVLCLMTADEGLLARLLYGTGLRLTEGLSLRVKDLDFDRHAIVVRSGKGDKDRVVMLPRSLVPALHAQLARAKVLWTRDRAVGVNGVYLPHALERKYRARERAGPGTGFCLPPLCRWIPRRAWSVATTCFLSACQSGSSKHAEKLVWRSLSRCTRCATVLQPTCCSRALTFARCRNFLAIRMCPPR
ncbi:integrase/recombinase [Hydrogenophaga sp. T4]|nr:integrase/recombinase [Hydrogenophaga sp. T4]